MNSLTIKSFKALLAPFAILLSSIVYAHPNPQYRACNERGAEFVVAYVGMDQVGLCKVGASYVGAIDSMNWFYESRQDLSIANYADAVISCPLYIQTVSLEGHHLELCQFQDSSIIDFQTIMKSKYSPENSTFNVFLNVY